MARQHHPWKIFVHPQYKQKLPINPENILLRGIHILCRHISGLFLPPISLLSYDSYAKVNIFNPLPPFLREVSVFGNFCPKIISMWKTVEYVVLSSKLSLALTRTVSKSFEILTNICLDIFSWTFPALHFDCSKFFFKKRGIPNRKYKWNEENKICF